MTRGEAIFVLEHIEAHGSLVIKAREMAIEALKQEPCEDAISRQAAIETIDGWLKCNDYNNAERHIMRAVQSVLYDLPSVTPKQRTGHWEWRSYPTTDPKQGDFFCTACGGLGKAFYEYCPNCGAKMESEEQA